MSMCSARAPCCIAWTPDEQKLQVILDLGMVAPQEWLAAELLYIQLEEQERIGKWREKRNIFECLDFQVWLI